jgi:hypothetical protein
VGQAAQKHWIPALKRLKGLKFYIHNTVYAILLHSQKSVLRFIMPFRVTIAMNWRALTCCMNITTAVVMKSSVCFELIFCLAYSSTMKMEATSSSETSADFQQTARRYIPEGKILYKLCSWSGMSVHSFVSLYRGPSVGNGRR